ncbi:MAG: IPT/TIG domain-containing protein, partial [Actinomycetota bacterium]|nr:IPT/TIG domain-containing protein [Actinomycetota bacterium]
MRSITRLKGSTGDHRAFSVGAGTLLAAALLSSLLIALLLTPALLLNAGGKSAYAAEADADQPSPSDPEHNLGGRLSPAGDYQTLQMACGEVELAAKVDLSAELPPVGDQGAQNSCVGWSTGYYYKSWWEKQEHPDAGWDLTNPWYQYSPSFVYNQINGGVDDGATYSQAFSLLRDEGCTDIAYMPYNQADFTTHPNSAQLSAALPYSIGDDYGTFWQKPDWPHKTGYVTPNDITQAKAWLNSGRVLVMMIPIYEDFPDYGLTANPASKYYDYNSFSNFNGGHAVCICGYDDNANPSGVDADHKGGFLMANSWGPAWNGASNGFVYLSYDFVKRYVPEAWWMEDTRSSQPVVSSFVSQGGGAGDTIYIYGENFGALRRDAGVTMNGIEAAVTSFEDHVVTATIPPGDSEGPLLVRNWDGETSEPVDYPWTIYFAEGYTGDGFEEWLCLMNPAATATTAQVTYMFDDGSTES